MNRSSYESKIKSAEDLREIIGPWPREEKVIMCHGTFDIVHPGHIRHLMYASEKAEILVASLTCDAHISKDNIRPFVPEKLRAMNLAALEMVARNIIPAVKDQSDQTARSNMMLAATFAGVGFGNAGVHLAHGMSYPVSGMVKDYVPEGYPEGHAMVPHGMGVILTAPSVFRYTAPTNPDRHLHCARILGADTRGASPEDAGDLLATAIVGFIRDLDMPNGLAGVGYTSGDIGALVAGTLPQHRVTKLSPRPFQRGLVGNRDGYRPYTLSGSEDFKVTADMRCRWLNDKADIDLVAGIGRIQSDRDDRNE